MGRWRDTRRDLGGRSQDVPGRNGRRILTDDGGLLVCREKAYEGGRRLTLGGCSGCGRVRDGDGSQWTVHEGEQKAQRREQRADRRGQSADVIEL